LEDDKGERVAKTNVWSVIKRNRKNLQEIEDDFKEGKRGNSALQATRLRMTIDCKLSQA